MRAIRRQAALDPRRSAAIVDRLDAMPELAAAGTVMSFDPVPGEPDLRVLGDRLRARGTVVVVPDPEPRAPHPIDPTAIDVLIVPGVAFTREGDRIGQGGGWYDRFLAAVRPDCTVIGVCFDEQLVDELPTEPHDVRMEYLVTPTTIWQVADRDGS
jgi:5-formyltetrahydrofolate cyclo-ligase